MVAPLILVQKIVVRAHAGKHQLLFINSINLKYAIIFAVQVLSLLKLIFWNKLNQINGL